MILYGSTGQIVVSSRWSRKTVFYNLLSLTNLFFSTWMLLLLTRLVATWSNLHHQRSETWDGVLNSCIYTHCGSKHSSRLSVSPPISLTVVRAESFTISLAFHCSLFMQQTRVRHETDIPRVIFESIGPLFCALRSAQEYIQGDPGNVR